MRHTNGEQRVTLLNVLILHGRLVVAERHVRLEDRTQRADFCAAARPPRDQPLGPLMNSRRRVRIAVGLGSVALLLTACPHARAEASTIREPGEHPDYVLELEPEAIVLFGRPLGDGPGAGVRASIPFMKNGFIPTLNNVPAISFGISRSPLRDTDAPFYAPIVLQWSFWLARQWSVLGEAGAFLVFGNGTRLHLDGAFMGGGRFHVTDTIALTLRVSLPDAPAVGFGVSFFL
jgi:hypothetical protein